MNPRVKKINPAVLLWAQFKVCSLWEICVPFWPQAPLLEVGQVASKVTGDCSWTRGGYWWISWSNMSFLQRAESEQPRQIFWMQLLKKNLHVVPPVWHKPRELNSIWVFFSCVWCFSFFLKKMTQSFHLNFNQYGADGLSSWQREELRLCSCGRCQEARCSKGGQGWTLRLQRPGGSSETRMWPDLGLQVAPGWVSAGTWLLPSHHHFVTWGSTSSSPPFSSPWKWEMVWWGVVYLFCRNAHLHSWIAL